MNEQHSAGSTETRPERSRFRKKPIEVDAWQYNGANDLDDSPLWVREYICEIWVDEHRRKIGQRVRVDLSFWDCSSYLRIPTLEGIVAAVKGDWVIRGVKGELYPCKPDIFEATYERV